MKAIKQCLLMSVAGLVFAGAQALACEPIQIRTTDAAKSVQYFGNGFAVSPTEVITADHVLAPSATAVDLRVDGQTVRAHIEKRSYNLDLALLKVTSHSFALSETCSVVPSGAERLSRVQVTGIHIGETNKTTIEGLITNAQSGRLMVPGVANALEIAGAGVSHSLSGSPVITRDGVVGLIAEMVPNDGVALAIPASTLAQFIADVHAGTSRTLPYKYDYSTRTILFSGLQIQDTYLRQLLDGQDPNQYQNQYQNDVAGGDPHGLKNTAAPGGDPHGLILGGDPHGGLQIAVPVAAEARMASGVLAKVVDPKVLAAKQPRILATLGLNDGSKDDWTGLTLEIQSIDGLPTPNLITFLRVLSKCTECQVDQFLVQTKDPATISDNLVRASSYAENLARDLRQRPASIQRAVVVDNVERYAADILTLLYDLKMLDSYNLDLARQMFATWSIIESELDAMPIGSDQELSDSGKVRVFNAVLKAQLASEGLM